MCFVLHRYVIIKTWIQTFLTIIKSFKCYFETPKAFNLIYVCPFWGKTNDWKILGSKFVRSTRSRNVLSMESTISCAQKYDNQIYHRQQSVNTCSYVVKLEKNQTSKLFSARRRTRSLPFNISHELMFQTSLLNHPPSFSFSILLYWKGGKRSKAV